MTKPAAPTRYAIAPNGQAVAQTDEQAIAGRDNGYEAIDGDTYRRQLQANEDADYVDKNWGTTGKTAAGLASGLTLGLAPSLASKMGLVDQGHLEAAEQSGAYTAGDVAGMVAPALLSGGESLAARGLAQGGLRGAGKVALALTPAGLMGEAGGLAERAIARFLPEAGIMGSMATPTLKMAARGAAEGAINNLAHTTADAVIQNKPLAANALLMSSADGAFFGGLMGGVMGGASAALSAGVGMAGGRVASAGAPAGEAGAAKAMRFLGASDSKLADMGSREVSILERAAGKEEGGIIGTARKLKDVLDSGEGSISSGVKDVHRASVEATRNFEAGVKDAVTELQKSHPDLVPKLDRVGARLDQELNAQFGGSFDAREVGGLNRQIQRNLRNVKTWDGWTKTRDSIAEKLQGSVGTRKEVLKTALNIVDDEMVGESSALMAADPELAKKYAGNVVGRLTSREFVDMAAAKAAAPTVSPLNVGHAVGSMGWATLVGANPLVGAGMIAGKQVMDRAKQALAPHMAEAAFRNALGAQAGAATVNIGARMSAGVKSFLNGTRVAIQGQHAEDYTKSKPSYTMESYKKSLAMADELTSVAHQQKVRETTAMLAQQGHEELAQEMAETYGRAVAYVNQNKPKKGLAEHAAGKLGKVPAAMGLDTKDMKFIRQVHAMTQPMGAIIGGLERGDISRDAVAAFQNVFPAAAADLNMRVAQEVVEYRNEGKFVPADKIAMLGTLLNAPVDSKLEPEFVDACQQGLAANKAPPPNEGDAQPPQTDTSSFQTPLQSSIG